MWSESMISKISKTSQSQSISSSDSEEKKIRKKIESPFFKFEFNPFDSIHGTEIAPFSGGKGKTTLHRLFVNKSRPNQKIYAVKKMYFQRGTNTHANEIYERQKFYLQNVNSQNCVKYYGLQKISIENQIIQLDIFMEYCQGYNFEDSKGIKKIVRTLRDYLNLDQLKNVSIFKHCSKKEYQELQIKNMEIILEILVAVYDLNSKKIIHRDLKPENILFTSDGSVKLADFDTINNYYEDDSLNCGTFGYRALQTVFECDQVSTLKADIWSLGVMFYELFNINKSGFPYDLQSLRSKFENNPKYRDLNSQDLTKEIYKRMKQQGKLEPTQIMCQNLHPFSLLIERMLKIQNKQRISYSELYSDSGFLKILIFMLSKLSQEKKKKILRIFKYKADYKQISEDIQQTVVKKQKQFQELCKELNKVKTLKDYFISINANLIIRTKGQQNNFKLILLNFYKLLQKLLEHYHLGCLSKKSTYTSTYNKIMQLKFQLSYSYHANFGQQIDIAESQNLPAVSNISTLINFYQMRRINL